jgi:hypothetical protein
MSSPDQALQTMIDNMPEKTGKSLEEWKKVLAVKNFEKFSEAVKYLKTEHGVTHGYANTIVNLAKDEKQADNDLVLAQYKGKETLLTMYAVLLNVINTFGKDIVIAPKKANVSLRTKKQFALIQPTTKTRIDLGLKLRDQPVAGRLEASGPFGTMCTHRIQLTDVSQIDDEVIDYLRAAYEESKA